MAPVTPTDVLIRAVVDPSNARHCDRMHRTRSSNMSRIDDDIDEAILIGRSLAGDMAESVSPFADTLEVTSGVKQSLSNKTMLRQETDPILFDTPSLGTARRRCILTEEDATRQHRAYHGEEPRTATPTPLNSDAHSAPPHTTSN